MSKFTFADVCCGIGGYRYAMEAVGGECVFACEKDEDARRTYERNFGVKPLGDIRDQATIDAVPDHVDVVCCDIPTKPFEDKPTIEEFSNAGLNDTDGAVFFDVYELFIKRQHKKGSRYDNWHLKANVILMGFLDTVWTKSRFKEIDEPWIKLISHYFSDYGTGVYVRKDLDTINIPLTNHMDTVLFVHPDYWVTEPVGDSVVQKTVKEFNFKFTSPLKHGERTSTLRDFLENGVSEGSKSLDKSFESMAFDVDDPEARPSILGDGIIAIKDKGIIRHLTPREYLNLQGFPKNFKFADGISEEKQIELVKNSTNVAYAKAFAEQIAKNDFQNCNLKHL